MKIPFLSLALAIIFIIITGCADPQNSEKENGEMTDPVKKTEQQPESYGPGEKPLIVDAAVEKAAAKYEVYKDIEFYIEKLPG